MHDIWGLYNLTPQRYLTHERLSHNLYRCLLHLRDRRNLLLFWDVVGASIKSIPTKYHTLGTTFTGSKSIIAAGVSRERSRVTLFEDPRFLFLGDNKSSNSLRGRRSKGKGKKTPFPNAPFPFPFKRLPRRLDVEALCHPSPWSRRTRTLILSHTRTFWQIFAESFFAL